ncbi:competence protein ComK [Macrococcus capreoli]|uniref:competence protein ComK n=1 Tax=Macrococcus capreoli TaxID=2982690 RepID=UPI003F444A01
MLSLALETTDMCIYQSPEAGGKTKIYYLNGQVTIVERRVEKLLDDTLIYFGSNLKTRRLSAKVLTQQAHHLPIIIEPTLHWMYYPVHQSKAHFQMYVQHSMIYHFEGNKDHTTLYFINNMQVDVPQSIAFIQKQHLKALYLADMQSKIIKRQLHISNHRMPLNLQ